MRSFCGRGICSLALPLSSFAVVLRYPIQQFYLAAIRPLLLGSSDALLRIYRRFEAVQADLVS